MPAIDAAASFAVCATDGRAFARSAHVASLDPAGGTSPKPAEPLTYGITERSAQPKDAPLNHSAFPNWCSSQRCQVATCFAAFASIFAASSPFARPMKRISPSPQLIAS
jgi:hypothetical protein